MKENQAALITVIGVALDGSELAAATIPLASELSRSLRAPLVLISVVNIDLAERFAGFGRAEGVSLVDSVVAYHDRLVVELRDEGIVARSCVVASSGASTAEDIMEAAEQMDASMLVIGSHGRSGMKRALSGSVAEEMSRSGRLPVLVVRPSDHLVAV
jgi:nucleotide-binding universal stress UspA family protein